ncbi:unnamed protein product [Vicia faba]|uniref:Secreted protein n=1 Tax=Vicia faba TaxID=3906 RepID=A0AAV0YDL0_VICFA|nr:unnamed protein product [Vicia faba]
MHSITLNLMFLTFFNFLHRSARIFINRQNHLQSSTFIHLLKLPQSSTSLLPSQHLHFFITTKTVTLSTPQFSKLLHPHQFRCIRFVPYLHQSCEQQLRTQHHKILTKITTQGKRNHIR